MSDKPFEVMAGKFEEVDHGYFGMQTERSVKFSVSVETLDQALDIGEQINDYPWSEIHYKGWTIDGWKAP